MKNLTFISLLFGALMFSTNAFSSELDSSECKSKPIDKERSFTKNLEGVFNGKKLTYSASLKEKILYEKDDPSAPLASFFYSEYIVESNENRPIMFVFNGGPGSASLWLHMGVLGPKVVKVPSDASDD